MPQVRQAGPTQADPDPDRAHRRLQGRRRPGEYLPESATLRWFADRVYWLFDTPKDFHQASCRRSVVVRKPAFRAVPELVKAMEQLGEERFPKLMEYLDSPAARGCEPTTTWSGPTGCSGSWKVRYKWRRLRTLVRFVVLKLDEAWSRRSTFNAAKLTAGRAIERGQ